MRITKFANKLLNRAGIEVSLSDSSVTFPYPLITTLALAGAAVGALAAAASAAATVPGILVAAALGAAAAGIGLPVALTVLIINAYDVKHRINTFKEKTVFQSTGNALRSSAFAKKLQAGVKKLRSVFNTTATPVSDMPQPEVAAPALKI